MTFTEKLDHLMADNGLSKMAFAKKCGIPYTTVCGWYTRGSDGVRLDNIRRIADTFHTTLAYWAYDDEDAIADTKKEPPAPEGAEDPVDYEVLLDLLIRLGFIEEGFDLSDEDVSFLTHIVHLLDLWFTGKSR